MITLAALTLSLLLFCICLYQFAFRDHGPLSINPDRFEQARARLHEADDASQKPLTLLALCTLVVIQALDGWFTGFALTTSAFAQWLSPRGAQAAAVLWSLGCTYLLYKLITLLCLSEVGLVAGALVSVDDLYAAVMAIAVHSHWIDGARARADQGDLRLAIHKARNSLESGQWPEHLQRDLRRIGKALLPGVLAEIGRNTLEQHERSQDRRMLGRKRLAHAAARQIGALERDWGLCPGGSIAGVRGLLDELEVQPESVAERACDHLIERRSEPDILQRARPVSRFLAVFGQGA